MEKILIFIILLSYLITHIGKINNCIAYKLSNKINFFISLILKIFFYNMVYTLGININILKKINFLKKHMYV